MLWPDVDILAVKLVGSAELNVAAFLDANLLYCFQLTLQPRKFSPVLFVAADKKCGGPE
jgi:hypothetical protein